MMWFVACISMLAFFISLLFYVSIDFRYMTPSMRRFYAVFCSVTFVLSVLSVALALII